jgi:hypothetical protein
VVFSIEVNNRGTVDAASYSLTLGWGSSGADCTPDTTWVGTHKRGSLPPTDNVTEKVSITCDVTGGVPLVWVDATVAVNATDPDLGNNEDTFNVPLIKP